MGFHYGTTDMTFEGGWNACVNDWLDGNVENGKWIDHVAGWYERSLSDPEHVMVVRYEDLKRDTQQTIQKIASFVGVETLEQEEMQKVLQQLLRITLPACWGHSDTNGSLDVERRMALHLFFCECAARINQQLRHRTCAVRTQSAAEMHQAP